MEVKLYGVINLTPRILQKEKMNGMQSLVSMKPIYRKEKEVSSKETSVSFNVRNMNCSLKLKGFWYMSQINYRIHNS
jgi:hypothetical protein